MKNTILLCYLFFTASGIVVAQNEFDKNDGLVMFDKQEHVTAPNVAEFNRYGLLPVNEYTGKVNVSVPIFTIQTGNLSYPINLNYNAGGIKVDNIASNVGLGWSVTQSNITRVIKDRDDFDNLGYRLPSETIDDPWVDAAARSEGALRIGWLYNGDMDSRWYHHSVDANGNLTWEEFINGNAVSEPGIGQIIPPLGVLIESIEDIVEFLSNDNVVTEFNYPEVCEGSGIIDQLPDIYYINTPSFTSSFYLEKGFLTPGSSNKVKELNVQGTKFNLDYTDVVESSYEIAPGYHFPSIKSLSTIEVVDNNGVKYIFGRHDVQGQQSGKITNQMNTPDLDMFSTPTVSSWNLMSITDPISGKKINFEYESYSIPEYDNYKSYVYKGSRSNDCSIPTSSAHNNNNQLLSESLCDYVYTSPPHDVSEEKGVVQTIVKFHKINRLKRIVFDEGEVVFNYDLQRQDLNDKALTSIEVNNYLGDEIKKVDLNYTYFQSPNCNTSRPQDCKRLRLDAIQEKNVGLMASEEHKPPYVFEYNDMQLPERHSPSQDFLGYYNGAAYNTNERFDTYGSKRVQRPELYYYQGLGANTIIPFKLISYNSGQFLKLSFSNAISKEANDNYSKACMLMHITYPTGGFTDFEYESNDFLFNYNIGGVTHSDRIKGGGVRIRTQRIYDEGANPINYPSALVTKNYYYNYFDGKTSGTISNIPMFAHLIRSILPSDMYTNNGSNQYWDGNGHRIGPFDIYEGSLTSAEFTKGAYVGYSKVTVVELNKGKIVSDFTSNDNFPDVWNRQDLSNLANVSCGTSTDYCYGTDLINTTAIGTNLFTDKSIQRGNKLKEWIYNENDVLKQYTTYEYEHNVFATLSLEQLAFGVRNATKPLMGSQRLLNSLADLNQERIVLKSKQTRDYIGDPTLGYQYTESTIEYVYDSQLPLVKEITGTNSKGEELKKEILYINDLPSSNLFKAGLLSQNRLAEKTEVKFLNDNLLTYAQKNIYANCCGIILPEKVVSSLYKDGTTNITSEFTIHTYDANGNPMDASSNDGLRTVYLWGYGGGSLVAVIQNSNISEVLTALNVPSNEWQNYSGLYNLTELDLEQTLNQLRSLLPNAMMTFYTSKPLVGIKGIKDAKNAKLEYKYDGLNRLETLRDNKGFILNQYIYHYRAQ